jgi:hypothetical protein
MGKDVFADIADSYIQTSDKLAAALSPTIRPEQKKKVYPFADYYAAKQPKVEPELVEGVDYLLSTDEKRRQKNNQLKNIPESVLSTEPRKLGLLEKATGVMRKPTEFVTRQIEKLPGDSIVEKGLKTVASMPQAMGEDIISTVASKKYREEKVLDLPTGKSTVGEVLNYAGLASGTDINVASQEAAQALGRTGVKLAARDADLRAGQYARDVAAGMKKNVASELGARKLQPVAKAYTSIGGTSPGNEAEEIAAIKEMLANDRVASYQVPKTYTRTVNGVKQISTRNVGLTDILGSTGQMKENLTIREAKILLNGKDPSPTSIMPNGRVMWEYVMDQMAEDLGFKSEDEFIKHLETIAAYKNRLKELDTTLVRQRETPIAVQTGLAGMGKENAQSTMFGETTGLKQGTTKQGAIDYAKQQAAKPLPGQISMEGRTLSELTTIEKQSVFNKVIDRGDLPPDLSFNDFVSQFGDDVFDVNTGKLTAQPLEDMSGFARGYEPPARVPATPELAAKVPAAKGVPEVITEEEYLSKNGAPFMGGAEPALHKNIQEGRAKQQAIAKVSKDMQANIDRRVQLREEYQAKVASGEIRPPTRNEKLIRTAQGNPDNESVQAARRILDKNGIKWQETVDLPPQAATQATQAGKGVKPQPVGWDVVPPSKPPVTTGAIDAIPPEVNISTGIQSTIAQAKAIVQRDKPGIVTRMMDYVPGLKQVRHGLQPALDMPENITTGWVGQGLARGSVDTSLQQARIGQLEQLERVFGKGATATQDFKPAGVIFKGIPEQAKYPYVGTLADIMTRPSLYELSAEQKAALSTIQSNRSAGFNSVKAAYNLDINEFPVEAGGVHLPNVDVSEDAITMSGSLQNALNRGRSKERFYNTAADRWAHDNTFRPETTISKLLAANDTTLANMSGQKVFLEGIGGKTRLEVIQETHPELAAKMLNLRKRVQKLQGYKSILKEEQGQALDDFLNSPIEVADLDELRSALDVKLVPGRYVAKAQAGKDLLTVQKEINGVKAQIAALRPAWNTANLKPYTFVQDGVFRYLPIDEANQVRNLLKTTNSPWLRFVDNLRATAFGGDLSPITIQGATAWFSDPIGASRFIAQGKGGLTQASLLSDMKANPESWQRFVAATGINPLGGVEQEFATGFLSQIPKGIGKGWADWNEALYRPITKMQKDIFESSYQGAIKRGLTPKQAAAIGADDATKIIPRYNFRRLGQSQAEAAKYRAAVTSVSFLTQPAALTNDALKGLVKIATKQTITPTESFAVKRVVTLVATTTAIAVASNVYYAKNHGLDEEQAARDSIDPNSGKFMSLVLPNGAKISLGGPFRGLIRAVVPKKIEGVAVPMPFAGLYNFAKNRMNPAVRIVWDEVRNKDYEGNRIRSGNFPINVLKGLEYAFEGSVPLTIGTIAQNKRTGEDWGTLGQETASQFMGTNYQADDPIYTASLRWDKDLSDYNSIPTNTIELKAAQKKDSTIKSRENYRKDNPEVDAKLFITGDGGITSLKSAKGVDKVVELVKKNNIDWKEIPGIKQRQDNLAEAKKSGITLEPTIVDTLITRLETKGAKTPPMQPTQTPTPTPTPVPTNTPASTKTPAKAIKAGSWEMFETIYGTNILTPLNDYWYEGKTLTPEQTKYLQSIYQTFPLGQTNFNTWYKQTLRQLYEKSATEGVK